MEPSFSSDHTLGECPQNGPVVIIMSKKINTYNLNEKKNKRGKYFLDNDIAVNSLDLIRRKNCSRLKIQDKGNFIHDVPSTEGVKWIKQFDLIRGYKDDFSIAF